MSEYAGRQFVGIDLHRRRSVLVRTTESGDVLESVQILNDVDRLNGVIARSGESPEVVLEATYGGHIVEIPGQPELGVLPAHHHHHHDDEAEEANR